MYSLSQGDLIFQLTSYSNFDGKRVPDLSCPKRRYASIVLEVDENLIHFTAFNNALDELVPDSNTSDSKVAEMLLLMDDIAVTYDTETLVVSKITAAT